MLQKMFFCDYIQSNINNWLASSSKTTQQCDQLSNFMWSSREDWLEYESNNAFTVKGFDSIQSLNNVTWLYLKTVCKLIRSALDPMRVGFYEEYKLNVLYLWLITRKSQEQSAQKQQFTHTAPLEYAAMV